MKYLSILLLSFLVTKSCNTKNTTEIPVATFTIINLENTNTAQQKLTIHFDTLTNKFSGFSGCNRYFGTYTTQDDSINFGNIASTRKLCTPQANAIEMKMLKLLKKSTSFQFKSDTLLLKTGNTILIKATQNNNNYNDTTIKYSASSRTFFKQIQINSNSISVSEKKEGTTITKPITTKSWNAITNQLKQINITTISTLKAPSNHFKFDGDALAQLKITHQGNQYETAPFDHKNPPKNITKLIKEILSISENIE